MKVVPVSSNIKQGNTEQSKQAHSQLECVGGLVQVACAEVPYWFRGKLNKMHMKAVA